MDNRLTLYAHPFTSVHVILLALCPYILAGASPQIAHAAQLAQAATTSGWEALLSGTAGAITVLGLWVGAFLTGKCHPPSTVDVLKERVAVTDAQSRMATEAVKQLTDSVDSLSDVVARLIREEGHRVGG